MIVLIPLRDLTLFTGESPDTLSEDGVVARIRADHPALFAGAKISVADGMVSIEFPETPLTNKAEAARLLEKGVQRSRQGEYRKAAGILERVLELDPASGPACRNLGMVLMELGETEKARQYLVESALHDPTDPWPYVVLGNALVRDNIAYGRPEPDHAQIEAAARAARADDFIAQMPQGYDTLIGDRGVRLSGGQQQRLALARALLKDPPILILDEATAMFDPEGEAEFLQACRDTLKHRTVLLITHRPASLAVADRIVRMEQGRIIEMRSGKPMH